MNQKPLFICYPRCTTCQKAKRWLDDKAIDYELRDIAEHKPTADELACWHRQSGRPLRQWFNTSGRLYKSLELKEKLPGMPETEQIDLLATDGMLVKRPLFISGDHVLVGFKQEEWDILL